MSRKGNWTENPSHRLTLNILEALGGDTNASYENTNDIWKEIDKIYDSRINKGYKVEPAVLDIIENGKYDLTPNDNVDAYSPVLISVDVPQKWTDEQVDSLVTQSWGNGYDEGKYQGTEEQKSKLIDIEIYEPGLYEREDGYKSVNVSLSSKQKVYNGFQFTGGDMGLIEWDKYDWSGVYDTAYFFKGCTSSKEGWEKDFYEEFTGQGGKIIVCEEMFRDSKFTSIDLSDWNIAPYNVLNMFGYVSTANTIDISGIDFKNLKDISSMFYACNGTSELKPKILNTGNVENFKSFAYNAFKIVKMPQIDLSSAVYLDNMFTYCSRLEEVRFKGDPSNVTSLSSMFMNVNTTGILYYDDRYDYSQIISKIPSKWTAVPYNVEEYEINNMN